jgi:hypothetical protein
MKLQIKWFLWFLFFGLSFLVYFKTLCPTVTWAHFGENGPKLLTQIYTEPLSFNQPHLPYLAVAKLFSIFNADPAFSINLLSSFFAALTISFLFLAINNLSPKFNLAFLTASAASLCFAFSPVFWSQAVITETSTFNAFLLGLSLFLITQPRSPKKNILISLFPLGLLALNISPPLLFKPKLRSTPEVLTNLEVVINLFLENFPGNLFLLAPFGILWGLSERKKVAFFLGALILGEVFADSFFWLPTTPSFYLPSFLAVTIFIGLGLKVFLEIVIKLLQSKLAVSFENQFFFLIFRLKEAGKILKYATFFLLAFWLINTPLSLFKTIRPKVDLSRSFETSNFGTEALTVLPQNALLVAETDRLFNTLEYFSKVVKKEKQVSVIPADKNMEKVVAENIKRRPVFFALATPPIPVGEIKGKWDGYILVSKGPLYQIQLP